MPVSLFEFVLEHFLLFFQQPKEMDSGLCPGNYFDYLDDDIAKQRELELFDTWNGPGAFLGTNVVI